VLKEFPTQVARLTLVADPDGLLTEEGILAGLKERGFDLIPFEDPVEFRYAYESRYRAQWDRKATTDLVVVLRLAMGRVTPTLLDAVPRVEVVRHGLDQEMARWTV